MQVGPVDAFAGNVREPKNVVEMVTLPPPGALGGRAREHPRSARRDQSRTVQRNQASGRVRVDGAASAGELET
jgi:hypothetical protein